eukprot:5434598-Karenia_brevis.AAC.1
MEDGDVDDKRKASDRRLAFQAWTVAWDRYAVGAAILEQMSYYSCMKHKDIVSEIALTAYVEKRSPLLGVLYDEIIRKEWEDKAAKMQSSFDANRAAMKRNEDALRRARSLHDVLMNKSPSSAYERGAGKGIQKGGGKSSEKGGGKSSVKGGGKSSGKEQAHRLVRSPQTSEKRKAEVQGGNSR